jgi:hypothetical protein
MNRYATDADRFQFESLLAPNEWEVQLDDYIFDTFTASSATKRIMLTRVETELSKLKDGATVWLHASLLRDFECIILSNETNQRPWHIENINFRPIPDAQLRLKRGAQSYSEIMVKVHGLKFPKLQFAPVQFPGYKNMPEDAVFVEDYFGLLLDSSGYYNDKGHSLYVTTPDGGSYDIEGIAGGRGAFTLYRLQEGKVAGTAKGNLYNCHGTDTNSEIVYSGNTSAPPVHRYQGTTSDKVLAVRSGTDPFQWQHFIGDVHFKRLYAHNASTWFANSFQRWQDSGGQFVVDRGNNLVESYFVDGFGSNGLSLLSAGPTPDNAGPTLGDTMTFDKVYIYDGHRGIYVNNSASFGLTWRIKELYVGGMNDNYANITGEPKINYYLEHAGTDKFIIDKLYHDGSRPNIAKDLSKFQIGEVILLTDFPRPKYKFSHKKFTNWTEFVADFHPIANGTRMTYKAGQYVTDEFHPEGAESGVAITFCKCKKDHTSTSLRPIEDVENFEILTWDSKGVASDEAGWNPALQQRPYPPDNFTHKFDSPLKDFFWLTEKEVPQVDPKDTLITQLQQENDLLKMQLASAIDVNNLFQVKLTDALAQCETVNTKITTVKPQLQQITDLM